jgi:peptide/nickel transport system permease protein
MSATLAEIGGLPPSALAWRRSLRHPGLLLGAGTVLAIVLVALLAPLLAPYDPL